MLELNKIYNQNSKDLLQKIPDNEIDLICTSPPYKQKDGWYYGVIKDIYYELYRILKPNSLFFLNFGHLKEDKFRPFRNCMMAMDVGFKLADTIIWEKNHFTPLKGKKNLNNLTEFIFMLYKNEIPDLNRLSIGIPYKDKSNAKRFNNGLDLRCRGNIWKIPYETIQKKSQKLHKDRFPLGLPLNCIKLANLSKNSIIIDPFCGSATVCVAAKQLGHNYIGIDYDLKYYKIAEERLNEITKNI